MEKGGKEEEKEVQPEELQKRHYYQK